MQPLKLRIYNHQEDVTRMVNVAQKNGYDLLEKDAYEFWKLYSEKVEANWLELPEEDELLLEIMLNYSNIVD